MIEKIIPKVAIFFEINQKDIYVKKIVGGLSNSTYFLKFCNQIFILRIFGDYTDLFIDRKNELAYLNNFSKIGLAPKPLLVDLKDGFMVTDYFDGQSLTSKDLYIEEKLRNILKLQAHIHLSDFNFEKEFKISDQIDNMMRFAGSYQDSISKKHIAKSKQLLSMYGSIESKKATTHFDFIPSNIIELRNGNLTLIDWEYACIAPVAIELASFFLEAEFNRKEQILALSIFNEYHPNNLQLSEDEVFAAIKLSSIYWFHWTIFQSKYNPISSQYKKYLAYYDQIINF